MAFLYSRFLGERKTGTFVEVGANDGMFCSNSWGLAMRGWRGLLVEPVPELAAQCEHVYRDHPNITVLNCAVAGPGTDHVELFLAGRLTTANKDALQEYRSVPWASRFVTDERVRIAATSLDALLTEHAVEPGFDVLIVDVEGFESEVFRGFSISRWHPRLLVVELADTHPDLTATAESDGTLLESISDAGYRVVVKDMVNTVFVRQDVYREGLALISPR